MKKSMIFSVEEMWRSMMQKGANKRSDSQFWCASFDHERTNCQQSEYCSDYHGRERSVEITPRSTRRGQKCTISLLQHVLSIGIEKTYNILLLVVPRDESPRNDQSNKLSVEWQDNDLVNIRARKQHQGREQGHQKRASSSLAQVPKEPKKSITENIDLTMSDNKLAHSIDNTSNIQVT